MISGIVIHMKSYFSKAKMSTVAPFEDYLFPYISHLVYLYYRASRDLTRIFSLPEGYKGKYGI